MTRWCHCGAPMWRDPVAGDWCRVCWVMVTGTCQGTAWQWATYPPTMTLSKVGRAQWPVDECNSTEGTAATSNWLPEGAATLPPVPEDVMPTGGDARRLDYTLNRARTRLTPWGFRHRHRALFMTMIEERWL